MHKFTGLFRVFNLMFSDPCKISNQNLQTYLLSFGNSFTGSKLFCFFCSNQQTTFPPLQYGNLVVEVLHVILIVEDEEKN